MRLFVAAAVVRLACGRGKTTAEAFHVENNRGGPVTVGSSTNSHKMAFVSGAASVVRNFGFTRSNDNVNDNINLNMLAVMNDIPGRISQLSFLLHVRLPQRLLTRNSTPTFCNGQLQQTAARGAFLSTSASSCLTTSRPRCLSAWRLNSNSNLASSWRRRPEKHQNIYTGRSTKTTLFSMQQGGSSSGGTGGSGKGLPMGIRLLGTIPYLLPLLDGIEEGENLFRMLPELRGAVYTVLAPFLALWDNVPFLPLMTFILMAITAREQNTSRFVRFNIQQAIFVDVLLILLELFGSGLGVLVPDRGTDVVTNFSFYCLVAAVAYATAETVRGRVPNQIPLISAAAEMQLGP